MIRALIKHTDHIAKTYLQTLVYSASRASKQHHHYIYVFTYAVLFLGTPHLRRIIAKPAISLKRVILAMMPKKMSTQRANLARSKRWLWSATINNRPIRTVDEKFPLLLLLGAAEDCLASYSKICRYRYDTIRAESNCLFERIVGESSAAPIIDTTERSDIDADHRQMCKSSDG